MADSLKVKRIQFGKVLGELLSSRKEQFGSREELCRRLDISNSTLSSYVSGAKYPRLPGLCRLAEELDVSLDYLVLGAAAARSEAGRVEPLVDMILNMEERADKHRRLYSHVVMELERQLDAVAGRFVDEMSMGSSYVSQEETMEIEERSELVRVVSTPSRLKDDVVIRGGEVAPGPWFNTVANNLRRGVEYEYIAPVMPEMNRLRDGFMSLLRRECGVDCERLQMRFTETMHITGWALFRLPPPRSRSEGLTELMFDEYTDSARWLGLILTPVGQESTANLLMNLEHLRFARDEFIRMWDEASDSDVA